MNTVLIQETIHRIQMSKAHIQLLRADPTVTPGHLQQLTAIWNILDAIHRHLLFVKKGNLRKNLITYTVCQVDMLKI